MSIPSSIPSAERPQRRPLLRLVELLLLAAASLLFALHFVHLTADFPNHSPWMDWAKYTDEGWYGDAAIRHLQRGRWYLPGDFNPAVALPVWPLLEFALFRITGVSLAAARALSVFIFGLTLVASYALLRRFRATPKSLAPAAAVLLLAASPFCYAFTRLAILEPLLILLTLLALLAASYRSYGTSSFNGTSSEIASKTASKTASELASPGLSPLVANPRTRRLLAQVALGLLVPAMVLTKTTAVFLLPAIGWMAWTSADRRLLPFLRSVLPSAALAAIVWLTYFFGVVRPRFLDDYRYLFSANGYTGITLATAPSIFADTFADGLWIGTLIFPLGLLAAAASLATMLRPGRQASPLATSLLLWIAGYLAFLAYHDNLQPRYYLVVAVPFTLLVSLVGEQVVQLGTLWLVNLPVFKYPGTDAAARRQPRGFAPISAARIAPVLASAILFAIVALDSRETLHYVRHPEYSFTAAAASLSRVVLADRTHSPLVLSISGSNLSLMTGLPSICDDFGTMELARRVATYRPGWYATWNQVDDDKMDALATLYSLHRVAQFPAFDDPERNLLILYRLDPATPTRSYPRPRRRTGHGLGRHLIGTIVDLPLSQQPSETQLEH